MPRKVGGHHRALADQCGRQLRPHIAGIGEAVQHDHGRSRAADPGVDGGVAGVDLLDARAGWKGLDHLYTFSISACAAAGLRTLAPEMK